MLKFVVTVTAGLKLVQPDWGTAGLPAVPPTLATRLTVNSPADVIEPSVGLAPLANVELSTRQTEVMVLAAQVGVMALPPT